MIRGYKRCSVARTRYQARRTEALKILEKLKADSAHRYVPAYSYVMIYIGLGDKDQAFAWLDRDVAEHSNNPAYYRVEPMLDPLRSDPRFADLVRRVEHR